jgi:hypothetical protein
VVLLTGVGMGQARSARAATQHVYDVREYGAVGMAGVDDRGAIQKAVDACDEQTGATGHGVVYFPAGTYDILSTTTYTPPRGGGAQVVGLLYKSCLWRGDGVHRVKLNLAYTGAVVDAVVAVAGTDFAGNASSGGIENMEFDANAALSAPTTGRPVSGAQRCVVFDEAVDQNFRFDNNDCAEPLLYGYDLPRGFINGHFTELRFDGTGGYFMRMVCPKGGFLSNFDLSGFTFATSSGKSSMQPVGNILFAVDPGCSNIGSIKFRNARVEWNRNGSGIAPGGAFMEITGPTLRGKGGLISIDNVSLQNQVYDAATHPNWLVKFSQTDGSLGSGFVFTLHDFLYMGLSGFETGVGRWNAVKTVAWPGGKGASVINGIYGGATNTLVRATTTLQGAEDNEVLTMVEGPGDTAARFTQDASGGMAWGPGGSAATDTTLRRCGAGGLCASGLQVGDGGTMYSGMRTFTTGKIAPKAVAGRSCANQEFPVAGIGVGDLLGAVKAPGDIGDGVVTPSVGADGVLTLKFCNVGAESLVPPAGSYSLFGVR